MVIQLLLLSAGLSLIEAATQWRPFTSSPIAQSNSILVSTSSPQELPDLQYDPPHNFYKSAIRDPEQYSSNEVNASLQVYSFRAAAGDLQQQFQQTLLRDWIDPQYRETNVTGVSMFRTETIPGAQAVLTAQFTEAVGGIPKPHLRVLIIGTGGAAAIVDASANSSFSWQRVEPIIRATLASLRVVTLSTAQSPKAVDGPGPVGKQIAGLYLGSKGQYKPNLNRSVGYGDWVPSMHFYLFSADGRVYRSFDFTSLPGGDQSGFNYDKAQKEDPDNTGSYVVQGDQLVIHMKGQTPEVIKAPLPQGGRIVIETVIYQRQ